MSKINNRSQLLSHGNIKLREAALEILEFALTRADPYTATRNTVALDGNTLRVAELCFDLNANPRIFLIGAGKATFPIAKALEDILGDRITDGVITCKYGQQGDLARCRVFLASHPLPDEAGFGAALETLAMAKGTRAGDIVFGCFTGGSSALMPYPIPEITLEDKRRVNKLLLTCGANIIEINDVRKHLSQVKGGKLAQAVNPQASLINLTVSDVIGDPLDYITDPTVPDTSTLDDARNTLTKYDLWDRLPASVAGFLGTATSDHETPKESCLSMHNRHDFIIVAGDAACLAAEQQAKSLGFHAMILSTMLEGESRELGRTFAAIANEVQSKKRPLPPPAAIIGGGETTVRITGNQEGTGGPNQEFALAASLGMDDAGNTVVVGFDTDGTDGPSEVAGGIVDEQTLKRAREMGIDIDDALNRHDVTPVFEALKDAIHTGATGTNVNDLKLLLVS